MWQNVENGQCSEPTRKNMRSRRTSRFPLWCIISRYVWAHRDTQRDVFGFPLKFRSISRMFCFTLKITFKIKLSSIREIFQHFWGHNAFVREQIDDGLWYFITAKMFRCTSDMIKEFVDYLVKISHYSLRQLFNTIFLIRFYLTTDFIALQTHFVFTK
jgi:hypothetical protein